MTLCVENLVDNASLPYGLALLKGTVSPASQYQFSSLWVRVAQPAATGDTAAVTETVWPVVKGRFEAFVDLALGVNVLQLRCDNLRHHMRLVRRARLDIDSYVVPLWIVCTDDDGTFQAPPEMDNSTEAACDRIRLAAQMLQMFMAETLYAEGLGRKTFRLKGEEKGHVDCRIFRTKLRRNEAQAMTAKQLWHHLGCELVTAHETEKDRCKFLAFASFTEYHNPHGATPKNYYAVLELTKGHAALGGGKVGGSGLALFGTGCLYTWPRHLSEIVSCFTDTCHVDVGRFMDDSAGRGMHWACYSTSLGAVCHELGHTFDLGHDPDGIMARGFDDIVYFFVFPELFQHLTSTKSKVLHGSFNDLHQEIVCAHKTDENSNLEQQGQDSVAAIAVQSSAFNNSTRYGRAFWHRPSAIILAYHRWLNPKTMKDASGPRVEGFTITSSNPLRIVQLRNAQESSARYWEFSESQSDVFTLDLNSEADTGVFQEHAIVVVAEDAYGNLSKMTLTVDNLRKNLLC